MTKQEKLQQLRELRNPNLAILARIQTLKGDKGDKGDKGEDSTVTGAKGDKGDKGDRGDKGETGKNGKDGKDGRNGINGINGKNGKNGKDGKDGKTPTIDEIVGEAVVQLEKKKKKISIKDIHDLNELINFLKLGGFRGGGSSGGSFTVLNTSSTVDGSNQAFVFSTATVKPTLVCIDGAFTPAVDNKSVTQWTWNAGTKTVTLIINSPTSSIFAVQ